MSVSGPRLTRQQEASWPVQDMILAFGFRVRGSRVKDNRQKGCNRASSSATRHCIGCWRCSRSNCSAICSSSFFVAEIVFRSASRLFLCVETRRTVCSVKCISKTARRANAQLRSMPECICDGTVVRQIHERSTQRRCSEIGDHMDTSDARTRFCVKLRGRFMLAQR